MKFLKIDVTRKCSTHLYVKVPDDFDMATVLGSNFQQKLGEIAVETTDEYDWERSVEAYAVMVVTEEEATKFEYGELGSEEI